MEEGGRGPGSPRVDEHGVLVHPVVHADLQVHDGPGQPDRDVNGDADGSEIQLDPDAGFSGRAPPAAPRAPSSQVAGGSPSAQPRSGAGRFSHCVIENIFLFFVKFSNKERYDRGTIVMCLSDSFVSTNVFAV